MANQLDLYKALSVGRPWVLGIQNQVVDYCGAGICDALLQNSVSALEPFRYATGLFTWELVATNLPGGAVNPPNSDGDNIQLLANQELDLFTAGVGEPIPGGWWVQTISDTDLFKSGAPVNRGFMFLVTGLAMEAPDPFQRGGTGATDPTDPKFYSNWLQESHNGPGYSFLIQKYHLNYTAIQITYGDEGQSYRLGVMAFWPAWGGPAGAQTLRNGLTATPGMYLPTTTAFCIGSRDDVKQMTLVLTTGQSGVIQNNPAQPTIAGSAVATSHTINATNNGNVFAPVRAIAVGYIVCVPFENYCGIPTLTPDEVIMLRQRLGLQPPAPGTPPSPPAGTPNALTSAQ